MTFSQFTQSAYEQHSFIGSIDAFHAPKRRVGSDVQTATDAAEDWNRLLDIYDKAQQAYYNNAFQESYRLLQQTLAIDVKVSAVHFALGLVLTKLSMHAEAASHFAQSLMIDPDHADVWGSYSKSLFLLKRYPEAAAGLKNQITIEPQNASAYANLGTVQRILEEPSASIQNYNKAVELDPKHFEYRLGRGWTNHSLNLFAKAISDFTVALSIKDDDFEAYRSRGSSKLALDDHAGAVLDYNSAISLNPQDAQAWYGRGVALKSLEDSEGAMLSFSKAFQLEPSYLKTIQNSFLDKLEEIVHNREVLRNPMRDALEQEVGLLRKKYTALLGAEMVKEVFARHASADGENAPDQGRPVGAVPQVASAEEKSQRNAKKPKAELPVLPEGLSWPTERYKEASTEVGIVEFLERTTWPELIRAGFGQRRYLKIVDAYAATAITNYERPDPRNGGRRRLPEHLHFLTEREVTDRRIEVGGEKAILDDPRLAAALASRAARARGPSSPS